MQAYHRSFLRTFVTSEHFLLQSFIPAIGTQFHCFLCRTNTLHNGSYHHHHQQPIPPNGFFRVLSSIHHHGNRFNYLTQTTILETSTTTQAKYIPPTDCLAAKKMLRSHQRPSFGRSPGHWHGRLPPTKKSQPRKLHLHPSQLSAPPTPRQGLQSSSPRSRYPG